LDLKQIRVVVCEANSSKINPFLNAGFGNCPVVCTFIGDFFAKYAVVRIADYIGAFTDA